MKKVAGIIAAGGLVFVQGLFASEGDWESTIAAGLNVTSGNSETLVANGSVTAEKAGDVHEIRLGAELNYGENQVDDDTETTTDNSKAIAVYKYKMGGPYLYSDNSIFRDDLAEIDYRIIIGVGFGYYIIENDNSKLGLEIGAAYVDEKLNDGTDDDNISVRIAARHDQKMGEDSKLWLSAEYIPNISDSDDYLLNAEAGLEASLNASLSLRLVVQDRYDSIVASDRDRNDLSVISSLVYKL